jgi:hypothetical protein
VPDLQPYVPEKTDKTFDSLDLLRRCIPAEEYQQVDIRTGVKLFAPVPTDRDKRDSGLTDLGVNEVAPDSPEETVDKSAVGADDPARPTPGCMGSGQSFPGNLQLPFAVIDRTGVPEVALES